MRGRTACRAGRPTYGFEFDRDNVKRMDTGLVYRRSRIGRSIPASCSRPTAAFPAFNFVVLKDDKNYAAPYNMTPVVRKEIARQESEDRRGTERAGRQAQQRDDGASSTRASTSTRRRRKKWPRQFLKQERVDLDGRTRRQRSLSHRMRRRSFASCAFEALPVGRRRLRAALPARSRSGVAAAGSRTRRHGIANDVRRRRTWQRREREARILFDGRRAGLAGAAFAGAATIDALDAHDGHVLTKGHAGVAVLPALLAYRRRRRGVHAAREFLTCLVLGYEVAHAGGHRAARDGRRLPLLGRVERARLRGARRAACCGSSDDATAPRAGHRRVLGAARPDPARLRVADDGEGRLGVGCARGRHGGASRARAASPARRRITVERDDARATGTTSARAGAFASNTSRRTPCAAGRSPRSRRRSQLQRAHGFARRMTIAGIAIESFREAIDLGSQCLDPATTDEAQYSLHVSGGGGARLRQRRRAEVDAAGLRDPRVTRLLRCDDAGRGRRVLAPLSRRALGARAHRAARWPHARVGAGAGARQSGESAVRRRIARQVSHARGAGARDGSAPRASRRWSTRSPTTRTHATALRDDLLSAVYSEQPSRDTHACNCPPTRTTSSSAPASTACRPRCISRSKLAARGATVGAGGTRIVVLDKTGIGAGASGIACGVVRNNYYQPAMRELMAHCVSVWESDPEAYSYHPVGYMQISPEVMHAQVGTIYEQQKAIGYESVFIEGEAESMRYMQGLFHDWQAKNITSVLHEKRGGYANNMASLRGLAAKARGARRRDRRRRDGHRRCARATAAAAIDRGRDVGRDDRLRRGRRRRRPVDQFDLEHARACRRRSAIKGRDGKRQRRRADVALHGAAGRHARRRSRITRRPTTAGCRR